jgi:hypothetical protein
LLLTVQNASVGFAELLFVKGLSKALCCLDDILVDFGFNLGDVVFDQAHRRGSAFWSLCCRLADR